MSPVSRKPVCDVEALRAEMDAAELDFANAKLAYYARTEYKNHFVEFEDLKQFAELFIAKNRVFQRARWGKVLLALKVSNLLRE
jgi:hypothetical protein